MFETIFHASALITGDGPVIHDAAVVVASDGEICDVGRACDLLPRHAGAPIVAVRGVLFPALVNAHTHIELGALRGAVQGGSGFVAWVEKLVDARAKTTLDDEAQAGACAADELHRAGTAAVGDVSNRLAAVGALARKGLGGAVFHEIFGLNRADVEARARLMEQERDTIVGAWPSSDLAYSRTPSTLSVTEHHVVASLVREERSRGRRMSIHLAEHPADRRAVEHGDGPMVDWLRARLALAAYPSPMAPLFSAADRLELLAPDVLLVHLTDARRDELAMVAERGAHVVLCPRSNLHIETRLPPLLDILAVGIEPALGTDSLASNASLDVLAEARALADRFPNVSAKSLIQMATWNGARALGRHDLGRIARGSRPGIIAVDGDVGGDPAAFVLRNVGAPRRWVAGRTATVGHP